MAEKTRTVILDPDQVSKLFLEVLQAVDTDRESRKALEAADDELSAIVKKEVSLGGKVKFKKPDEKDQYEFSFTALRGFKVALVQAINGVGQQRSKATYGESRYLFMPIVEAMGKKMVEVVKRETKMNDDDAESEPTDWNEEPEAEALEDGQEVDLDGNGKKSEEEAAPKERLTLH